MIGRGAMTTPAACIPAWRESPSSRSAIRTTFATASSVSISSLRPGDSRSAFSKFTSGPSGTSLAMRSPRATGRESTRATSRTASFGLSCEKVTICATFSRPYLRVTYSMTSPRRAWQKSMSMSGIEIRSGFRNRSKSRS